jgi:hypothetical protein
VTVETKPARTKTGLVEIDLGDSKDATVEIVRERRGADVEINGYRVRPRWRPSRRYLFGQEQILDPPLPPSQFNPDPAAIFLSRSNRRICIRRSCRNRRNTMAGPRHVRWDCRAAACAR